jgi:hypothetical protein
MTFGDRRMTANGIVLVGNPNKYDDVKGSGTIIEELSHDGFHT